ncbi:NUDIX domain-containing protein [Bacillus tianshenii]|uniref:NUDIX domain-containing protein n=1 Tax=Sutcliffiella tianshenii TaxID=1463404 RepID=UPI001CD57B49|nr:NUDIX domain-containing protein [Bacillus tianshenii]MCA1321162.1 NUDIX domain-containing protein [Bacillus tianshenii]
MFQKLIGKQEQPDVSARMNYREAVRAVVLEDDKILLVGSNLGDFKLPGGGVEADESHEQALSREVKEETGFPETNVLRKIGVVIERHSDEYDPGAIFEMTSHIYLCRIVGKKGNPTLDDYEYEQEYSPEWVNIEKAISQNNKVLQQADHRWIQRENFVLNELIAHPELFNSELKDAQTY